MRSVFCGIVVAFSLFFFLPYQGLAKLVVKIASVAPANSPWSNILEQIQSQVEKQSNGEIQVKIYMGGQLGGELEIIQGLRRGRIDGAGLTVASLASVLPELDVLELPYLFDNSEQADFVLDEFLFPKLKELFYSKGLVFVSWSENGWRSIGLKSKLVKNPSDLVGVKVRSQESKVHLAFWKALKANPVPISTPDVLPSLQTGLVQGFDNTPVFSVYAKWYSEIKFFTLTEHIYQPGVIVYSKVMWDKLSLKQKNILMEKENALAAKARQKIRSLVQQQLNTLKDFHIEVYALTPAEKESFKKALKDVPDQVIKNIAGGFAAGAFTAGERTGSAGDKLGSKSDKLKRKSDIVQSNARQMYMLIQDGKRAFNSKQK